MPFVLDASIVACWALDDEDHPVADLALEAAAATGVNLLGSALA